MINHNSFCGDNATFFHDFNLPTSYFDISSPGGWMTAGGRWRNHSAAAAAAA